MRLSEIEISPPREDPIAAHVHEFAAAKVIPTPPELSAYDCREVAADGDVRLGIFSGTDLVAYLRVVANPDHGFMQVGRTLTAPDFRNKGLMRFLINAYVTGHGSLHSDNMQTPEAQAMWRHLIAVPGILKISVVNMGAGSKVATRGGPDPWDDSDATFLLAEHRMLVREWEQRDRKRLATTGRMIEWYLPGTDDCPNP